MKRPSLLVNAGLGVLVLIAGFFAYRTVWVSDTASTGTSATGSRIVPVSTGNVVSTVSASGTVQSASTANVDFATSGTVTGIDVKIGDAVAKGQVLAKLDPTAAQDQLNTAQANLASARQSLSRAQSASPVDQTAVTSAQAQVAQDQATVDTDQRALAGTVLTAPMAGTVTAINGSVGGSSAGSSSSGGSASATSGSSSGSSSGGAGGAGGAGGGGGASSAASTASSSSGFVQLADLTALQVSGYFAEADATKLKTGQAATVTWSALAGTRATGKLASISPTAVTQNNVNSYQVLVSLDAVPTGARLGQTTTVAVTVAESDNVLRLPAAAVRIAGGRATVQLVTAPGRTQTVSVQVGVQGDTFVEIRDGLSQGQQVAIPRQATPTTSGGAGGGGLFGGPGGGAGGFRGGGGGGGAGGGGARGGGGG